MTKWLDLESIMLREINQTEEDKYCMVSLICGIKNKKKKDLNLIETVSRKVLPGKRGGGYGEIGKRIQT